jgi:dTMP kinase
VSESLGSAVGNSSARGAPLFVVLDGVDGCGKSTQAARLVERLRRESGREVTHVREPGSTALGERVRALLLGRDFDLDSGVELLLFAAARRQMLREIAGPALARGEHVVCERFHASTFAYQSVAGGQPEADVLALLQRWASEPAPTHTVLLEVPPERAAQRRGAPGDRIEDKGLEFQQRVAAGYRRFVELVPGVRVVDGLGAPEEVAERIWKAVGRG